MSVILDRDGGDLARTHRLGLARLESAVRREITRRGGLKPCLRIVRRLFAALSDPAGVVVHRRGALERAQLLISDWRESHRRLADTEARMVAVLDELGLTGLVTSITGLSAVGAATILAQTGDLRRFATARAVVKHSGLAPREKASGSYAGRTKLTGQGRPGLRLAAWRAVWGAQRANPACAARYQHLTSREQNKLTPTQAQAAIAAALLRHLHAVVTTASAGIRTSPPTASGAPPGPPSPPRKPGVVTQAGRGELHAALRNHGYPGAHHEQPRPFVSQPDYTLLGPPPSPLCRDRRRARHRPERLTRTPYADERAFCRQDSMHKYSGRTAAC
jgi:hypothetical protein